MSEGDKEGGFAAMLGGMSPDKIAKKLLLGDFGEGLCKFLNRHQKGNRLLMEKLTNRPYPLKAVRPEQLYESIKGPQGNKGLLFVLELMEKQQHDIIAAFDAAYRRGQEEMLKERARMVPVKAAPAPAQIEADRDAQTAPDATIHGPPAEKVEVPVEAAPAEPAPAEAAPKGREVDLIGDVDDPDQK